MSSRFLVALWGALLLLSVGSIGYAGVTMLGDHSNAAKVLFLTGVVALGVLAVRLQWSSNTMSARAMESRAEADSLHAELLSQAQAVDSFAEGLDLAVLMCDERGTVEYANGRASEMFQFASPVGRSVLAITLSYDLEQLVLAAARTGEPQSREIGFPPTQEIIVIAKAWIGARRERVFLSMYDVSNLRRLERVRQDFVANVSHELRTPMSIIRAYAETLLDDDDAEQETTHRYLARMVEEVDRLSGITRDLLVLSSAESQHVHREQCDIADVFHAVVGQLQPKAASKGLMLAYSGVSHLEIAANPSQMTQIAINLIENAINYTSKGRIDVTLAPTSGNDVEIRVKDTGIGIAFEHSSRIFERFYRVDKGRSRSTGGTGLGLSIVKHIVEAHRGAVSMESALNIGTEFKVLLPIDLAIPGDSAKASL